MSFTSDSGHTVHGSVARDLPVEAVRSVEVDVAVRDDPDGTAVDTIDGSIGEASMFADVADLQAQVRDAVERRIASAAGS